MALPTASDNPFPSLLVTEGTEPAAPAAGKQRVYIDSSSHHLSRTDSSGTQVDLETNQSAGSSIPATIFDAKGDLIVASAADTAARQAAGADGTVLVYDAAQANGVKGVQPFGQDKNYPRVFAGDVIDGSSGTPFADVAAFTTKEVLNSRVLHLVTKNASQDQRVRVTLGTTKAAAFDVTTCVAFSSSYWSAQTGDVYLEILLTTTAPGTLAIARIIPINISSGASPYGREQALRVGGSSITAANDNIETKFPHNMPVTLRIVRDGANVITFYYGWGTAPLALAPIVTNSMVLFSATVSGTLARVEYSIHTPAGPGATAQWDAYVDYLASV